MSELRIGRLLEHISDGAIGYITASADMFYYSGFSGEGAVVISKNERVILTDGRYTEQAKKQSPDFEVIETVRHGDWLKKMDRPIAVQAEDMSWATIERFKATGLDVMALDVDFQGLRAVKDAQELEILQRSAKVAEKAYIKALEFIRAGITERELAAYINYVMMKEGAQKPSFDTISISGKNTSMPHGVPTDKTIKKGELVTMDFGAVVEGYCSDMTRTVAVGEISDRMREVYEIVKEASDTATDMAKDGASCRAVDGAARKVIEDAGYGEYFVHSTGHGVGVEIHEKPNLSPRSDYVLKKGNVVTVEPGIYIPDEFGVRIENTLVVEDKNAKSLQKTKKDLIIL